MWDLSSEVLQPLTLGLVQSRSPVWSPDGSQTAFSRATEDGEEVYWQAADSSGTPAPVTEDSGREVMPTDFSPDGTQLFFSEISPPRGVRVVTVGDSEQRHALGGESCS